MKPKTPNPLTELSAFLAATVARFKSLRLYMPLVRANVAQDIVADVQQRDRQIVQDAYSAEQCDREAIRLLDQFSQPGSDGGKAITAREALQLRRLLARGADEAHTVTELATP